MPTEKSDFKKLTECICPNCKKEHKIKIHWIGRGVPKIYCKKCKDHASNNLTIHGNSNGGSHKKPSQSFE
jgi:hypothetical protein